MTDYKKELEDFAYIVSHDLNAPLRHIKSFGTLLVDKLSDKVSGEEREYLEYLNSSVEKTENMLEALLEYSHINSRAQAYSEFNCHALVQSTLELFANKISQSHAQVVISDLPENLNADQNQIRQLFTFLIDNALKFQTEDSRPTIKISAQKNEESWMFSISDNGIGIPTDHKDNAFIMFRRLHPDQNFTGIGKGLALAKKIVTRHGGQICIESESNKGTTVTFSILK